MYSIMSYRYGMKIVASFCHYVSGLLPSLAREQATRPIANKGVEDTQFVYPPCPRQKKESFHTRHITDSQSKQTQTDCRT